MPRLSPAHYIFFALLLLAYLWTQNPRMFRSPAAFQNELAGIAASALAIILAITVHEANHAFVAVTLGDPTPKRMGRLSLNPLRHLDPLGTLLLFIAHFGWGKPVLFNPLNLRVNPLIGSAAVAFAGPLANVLFALVLVVASRAIDLSANRLLLGFIHDLITINVLLAAFNLVPIPPLDGFGVLQGLLPSRLAYALEPLRQYGPLILLVAIFLPRLGGPDIITPIMTPIFRVIGALLQGV